MPHACAHCSAPGATAYCSRCGAAAYCNAECQTAHWAAEHRAACAQVPPALRGRRWKFDFPITLIHEKLELLSGGLPDDPTSADPTTVSAQYISPVRDFARLLPPNRVVTAECAVFLQMYLSALAGIPLIVGIGSDAFASMQVAHERAGSNAPRPCYYTLEGETAHRMMTRYGGCNRGQWLAEFPPRSKYGETAPTYLGMSAGDATTPAGPTRRPLEWWRTRLVADLETSISAPDEIRTALLGMARIPKAWALFYEPRFAE